MKLRRILGAFAAASVAVCAVSVSSYAAPLKEISVSTGSQPIDNMFRLEDDGKIDLTKVKTVKAVITSTVEGNLGLGCNDAGSGKWAQTDATFAPGTQTITLKVDGIAPDEEDAWVVQIGIWWMNDSGTLTIDSIDLLDENGKVPEVVAVTTPAPEETEAPVETTEPEETETPAEPEETETPEEPTVEEPDDVDEPVDEGETGEGETEETEEEPVEDYGDVSFVDASDYFDGSTLFVRDEEKGGFADDAGIPLSAIYGVKYYVTFDDAQLADEEFWVGGGVGANSDSTGWASHEWGKASGEKEITPDFENGTIVWFNDGSIFTDDESFAQLWIQAWGGNITVDSVEVMVANDVAESTDTDTDAGETETEADDNKGNPDTGVAGVAVAAGVVALAGAAVVVSRKRK